MKTLKGAGEIRLGLAGMTLFVVSLGVNASRYGSRWACGRWYMPHTLLSSDGWHYASGDPIDGYSLALARSGWEEEFWLLLLTAVSLTLLDVIRKSFCG